MPTAILETGGAMFSSILVLIDRIKPHLANQM